MRSLPVLNSITQLRRTSADTVTLCDLIIYGSESEAHVALPKLQVRLELLTTRIQRVQEALRREGGSYA